ncbi:MAG: hypothetical protein V3T81_01860 [Thermoanaerobaculia bacterium]
MQPGRLTPGRRSRRLHLPVLSLAPLLGVAIACGNKEPPKAPPSRIPAASSHLTVQQRGRELLLKMTYPSTTMGGLAIENLEGIEVWELTRIVPTFQLEAEGQTGESEDAEVAADTGEGGADTATEGTAAESPGAGEAVEVPPPEGSEPQEEPTRADAEASGEGAPESAGEPLQSLMFRFPTDERAAAEPTPERTVEDLVPVDPREFADQARLLRTVLGSELDAAVSGGRLILRLPLSDISPEENEARIYAVKTRAGRRRISAFSNLVKILPWGPPSPPSSLAVTARPAGVHLSWTSEEPGLGFHVYRRAAQSREYSEPIFTASPELDSYLDSGALYGSRYIYTVTAVSSRQPLVESAIAAEYEIDYQDRFPPPTPGNLVALAEEARVRLLWEPTAAADLAGYRILRREPGAELQPIHTDPVVGQEYLDRQVVSGRTYGYAIVAVDQKGNRSPASEEIEVRVP